MRPAEEEQGWVKKYGAHIVRPASSRQQGSGAALYGRPDSPIEIRTYFFRFRLSKKPLSPSSSSCAGISP